MRCLILYTLFALCSLKADSIRVLEISPDNKWQVQLRQASGLDGGDPEFVDIVSRKTNRATYSFTTIRRSTDAGWSSSSRSLVINDRTATSGDFLYIFRAQAGHVILLRQPGDDALFSTLTHTYDTMHSTGRFTLTGVEWISDSDLRVMVTGGGYGDDASFTAVVHIDDRGRCALNRGSVKINPQ